MPDRSSRQLRARATADDFGRGSSVEEEPFLAHLQEQVSDRTDAHAPNQPDALLRREVLDAYRRVRGEPGRAVELLQLDPPERAVDIRGARESGILNGDGIVAAQRGYDISALGLLAHEGDPHGPKLLFVSE